MLLSEFDYYLPPELIAQTPLDKRDHSRLLVLSQDKNINDIEHSYFYNLPNYLNAGDTLVFNNTKVMPARLLGVRGDTGGKVEMLLLNRLSPDQWEVLVKPGKKARPGVRIIFTDNNQEKVWLECEILSVTECGGRIVRFFYEGVFEELLDILGQTPLPPYIKKHLADKNRYQTVYASDFGSAAAPTAGLHFTFQMLEKLKEMKVNILFVTLHVGLGTFRPVNSTDIYSHVMHREYYSVSEETLKTIEDTKKNGCKVIAVGTTAVRALETAAKDGRLSEKNGWTDIFIYPGYKFQVIDGLITNFHLPKSTLLMLTCAFAGQKKVLAAYEEAVKCGYRFFSFGDAMLIL